MRKEIIDGIIKDMVESNGARPSDIILKGVFSKKTDKYGFEFRWRIDKTLLADKELSTMDCLHYTKNVQEFIDSIAKDFEANSIRIIK